MVGVVAVVEEPLPQELRIAGAAISATNQTKRSQRTLALSKRKFGSRTARPPSARSDFPEEFVMALRNFAVQRRFAAMPSHVPRSDAPAQPHVSSAAETPHPHTRN